MDYITAKVITDSFEMGYLRFGTGGRTLVILPGLSVQSVLPSAPAIVNQYRLFAEDFTVYLFDRRKTLPSVYTVYDMARDTAQALKTLGLSDIYLFGVSLGGMTAMTIAADHPDMIKRLALCSTAMRVDERRFAVIREWRRLAADGDRRGLYLSFGEKVYPPEFFAEYRDAFAMISKTVTDEELRRFIVLCDGIPGFDLTGRADDIKCPVQFSFDEGDTLLGKDSAEELCSLLGGHAGFELQRYSGCGHALYDTSPDFGKRMYKFFTD